MRFPTLLTTLALAASTAHAADNYIHNNCGYDVWYTSVGGTDAPAPSKISSGSYIEEGQYFDKTGTAIKITKIENGIYTDAPVLHFSYSYKANVELYYDLSSAFGYVFWGEKITLGPTEGVQGKVIEWDGAPGDSTTQSHFGQDIDLILELCASG
ncbi:hypothetical protein EK21DRAFT_105966 [Setomelanomma holmii]|uniref:Uncharacterized protein n=1 Tax=Setomelanomma holmii TaxID=210430 RepID=A0A9P4HK09_9PLEO|nr:hypothetical protein EK21DRAFT_105966 [Setomelanomma holmii]